MSCFEETFIVTGAAGGIGKAVAKVFTSLQYPYTALFTVRDVNSANVEALRRIIQDAKGSSISSLDLSNLSNVQAFAANINSRVSSGSLKPIRAIVLNAGYMSKQGKRFTADGYEMNFQVNYLSNFYLVLLLLQSMDRENCRIIFITSWSADPKNIYSRCLPLRKLWKPVENLAVPQRPDGYGTSKAGLRRYAKSKLCLMMFMHSLQRRLDSIPTLSNIVALSVDPGCVFSTGIMREQLWITRVLIRKSLVALTPFLEVVRPNGLVRSAERSAHDILKACFSGDNPEQKEHRKAVILDGSRIKASSSESQDLDKQQQLWTGSLKLLGMEDMESRIFGGHKPVASILE